MGTSLIAIAVRMLESSIIQLTYESHPVGIQLVLEVI